MLLSSYVAHIMHILSVPALKCRRAIAIPLAWAFMSASAFACKMLVQIIRS